MRHLFQNFLHDRRVYRLNEQYYRKLFGQLRAWLDQFDGMDELVLSLELTDENLPALRRLAYQWWVEKHPTEDIGRAIAALKN